MTSIRRIGMGFSIAGLIILMIPNLVLFIGITAFSPLIEHFLGLSTVNYLMQPYYYLLLALLAVYLVSFILVIYTGLTESYRIASIILLLCSAILTIPLYWIGFGVCYDPNVWLVLWAAIATPVLLGIILVGVGTAFILPKGTKSKDAIVKGVTKILLSSSPKIKKNM